MMLFSSYTYCGITYAEDNVIIVHYDKVTGKINKNIFGNNFQPMDPRYHKYQWVDWVQNRAKYGGGVWDPEGDKPVSEVMELARNAGVSIVRYALSKYRLDNLVDTYDEAGNLVESPVKYGLDQFIETINVISAKPVIIIPIHPDTVGRADKDFSKRAKHASDIVEYLNTPVGENPDNDNDPHNENIAWADIRAKNGHPNPYHVRYFEIGNEPYVRPNIGSKPQEGGSGVDFFLGYGS